MQAEITHSLPTAKGLDGGGDSSPKPKPPKRALLGYWTTLYHYHHLGLDFAQEALSLRWESWGMGAWAGKDGIITLS